MNKKVVLYIISTLVLIAGIVVGVILVQQNQDIREKAAPATSVFISPANQSKNPGNTFTFSVNMDTGVNQITGVDIRLNYDPNLVEVTSIQKGSGISALDSQITNTFSNTTGKISYAIFTVNKTNAVTGSVISILTVNGNIKNTAGNASFSFDPATTISGINEGQNVIINSTPGNIIISSARGTATPTATATATATSRTTATATATSTATSTTKATNTSVTVTPTPAPIPVTGISIPTYFGIGLGFIAIFGSLLLF